MPLRPPLTAALALTLGLNVACKGGDSGDDSGATDDSTASEFHPNVPEGYEYKWDTDGCGEDGDNTQVYRLAEGSSTAEGTLQMTERWYWFFGGDWEDDCIDTIVYEGDRISAGTLNQLGLSENEEGYDTMMTKSEDGCPSVNYLYLWDHPDAKKVEYGDPLEQATLVVFDTLSPSGNLNVDNAMIVNLAYEVRSSSYSLASNYGRGVFMPDTDVNEPPAHYTWESDDCYGY